MADDIAPTPTQPPQQAAQAIPDGMTGNNGQAAQQSVVSEAQKFSTGVSDATRQVKDANAGLASIIQDATIKSKDTYTNIFEALHNKERIDQLPAFVTNIWGMFDPSMNEDVQLDKVKQGSMRLTEINNDVTQAAQARDALVSGADATIREGQARLSASQAMLNSVATVAGIKETGARTAQAIASTKSIMQESAHNQEQFLAHQYTPDQLANAAAGKDPKVAAGTAQDVLAQKQELQDKVSASALALKAGKVDFAEKLRNDLLTKSMDYQGDLVPLAEKMTKDNMSSIDLTDPRTGEKVTVTRGEVDKAIGSGYKTFIEQQTQRADVAGLTASLGETAAQIDAKQAAAVSVNGGSLTPEQTAAMGVLNTQVNTHLKMGDVVGANKLMTDNLNTFWAAEKKKAVDSATDLEKPAISQLFDKGKLTNAAATDYTFANAQSGQSQYGTPFAMFESAYGSALTATMRSQADKMALTLGAKNSRPGGNMSIADMFSGDDQLKNRGEIVAKLLSPTNPVNIEQGPGKPPIALKLADVYRNGIAEDYSTKLLQKLAQPAIAGTQTQTPYAQFLDQDGRIAAAYKQPDGQFNIGLLAQHLEAQTVKMRAAGALQPDQDLAVDFYKALQTSSKEYSDGFIKGADVNRRSYNQLINGDKPLAYFDVQMKAYATALANYGKDTAMKARNAELIPGNGMTLTAPANVYSDILAPGWTPK